MKKYDAIMIGFGKGAKTLAAEFAKQGKKVAMIEKSSKMYGGDVYKRQYKYLLYLPVLT